MTHPHWQAFWKACLSAVFFFSFSVAKQSAEWYDNKKQHAVLSCMPDMTADSETEVSVFLLCLPVFGVILRERKGKYRMKSAEVRFYATVHEPLLYAVMIARCKDQWVLVRHKERSTWEFPGGHIEAGESADAAARRELWEETGAVDFSLERVCCYGVRGEINDGEERFGMLYRAYIRQFGKRGKFEIAAVRLSRSLPDLWTYPQIQPLLVKRAFAQQGVTECL